MKNTSIPEEKTLLISEIFYSLQGEGPWIGQPSLFIRLGGCIEPYCPWCDTQHALAEMETMRLEDLLITLQRFPCMRVVITGGEPFLQWERGLSDLHIMLSERGYSIQYETSGKVCIPRIDNAVIVCSPKNIEGVWHFDMANLDKATYYKFLAGGDDWIGTIDEFIRANRIDKEKILIMPLGITRKEQMDRMEEVFGYSLQRGYRMSPRLHILTFNTRRGI